MKPSSIIEFASRAGNATAQGSAQTAWTTQSATAFDQVVNTNAPAEGGDLPTQAKRTAEPGPQHIPITVPQGQRFNGIGLVSQIAVSSGPGTTISTDEAIIPQTATGRNATPGPAPAGADAGSGFAPRILAGNTDENPDMLVFSASDHSEPVPIAVMLNNVPAISAGQTSSAGDPAEDRRDISARVGSRRDQTILPGALVAEDTLMPPLPFVVAVAKAHDQGERRVESAQSRATTAAHETRDQITPGGVGPTVEPSTMMHPSPGVGTETVSALPPPVAGLPLAEGHRMKDGRAERHQPVAAQTEPTGPVQTRIADCVDSPNRDHVLRSAAMAHADTAEQAEIVQDASPTGSQTPHDADDAPLRDALSQSALGPVGIRVAQQPSAFVEPSGAASGTASSLQHALPEPATAVVEQGKFATSQDDGHVPKPRKESVATSSSAPSPLAPFIATQASSANLNSETVPMHPPPQVSEVAPIQGTKVEIRDATPRDQAGYGQGQPAPDRPVPLQVQPPLQPKDLNIPNFRDGRDFLEMQDDRGNPIQGPGIVSQTDMRISGGMSGAAPAALAQSVSTQITGAAAQLPDQPVEISLSPEELGRVKLTLHGTEHTMNIGIHAERGETLDLMRRNIDLLARDMRELGFANVTFSFDSQSQDRPQTPFSQNTGTMRTGFDPLDEAPALVQSPRSAPATGSSGLDLRI